MVRAILLQHIVASFSLPINGEHPSSFCISLPLPEWTFSTSHSRPTLSLSFFFTLLISLSFAVSLFVSHTGSLQKLHPGFILYTVLYSFFPLSLLVSLALILSFLLDLSVARPLRMHDCFGMPTPLPEKDSVRLSTAISAKL